MSKFICLFNIFTQQMNQSDLLSRKINCVISARAAGCGVGSVGGGATMTGPTGPIGATGPIGYGIGLTLNGAWNANTSYVGTPVATPGTHIDGVTYNGSLYVCISNITGNASNQPPNIDTAHWQLYVVGGLTGPTGYGNRIYSGVGPPAQNFGAIGDFYIDTVTGIMYGPKV
jgi:hypothetical protein